MFLRLYGNGRFEGLGVSLPEVVVREVGFDEPSAALDPVAEARLLGHIAAIHRERGITVVLVSHRLELTAGLAKTIAIVDHSRGVLEVHDRDVLLTPDKLGEVFGASALVDRVGTRPVITFATEEAEHG